MTTFHVRLKKVQGKKKRDAEAAEVQRRLIEEAEVTADFTPELGGGGGDLLSSKDEDVIF